MPTITIYNVPKEQVLIGLFKNMTQEKELTERAARKILQYPENIAVTIGSIQEVLMHDITFGQINFSNKHDFFYTIESANYPSFQNVAQNIQQQFLTVELNTFNQIALALTKYKEKLVEPIASLVSSEDEDDDTKGQLSEIGTKTVFFRHNMVPIEIQKAAIETLLAVLDLNFSQDAIRLITLKQYSEIFYKTKMVNILHPLLCSLGFTGVEDFIQKITDPVVAVALPAFQKIDPTITLEEMIKDAKLLRGTTVTAECRLL